MTMREHLRADAGTSMVELLLVMILMGVVGGVFGPSMLSMQRSVTEAGSRSSVNDEVRLAIAEIDRQIRSGNVFYDPATESDPAQDIVPSMALRVYTQANAPTNDPGSRCVQWRISGDRLETRWWVPNASITTATAWRVVATGIVNRSLDPVVPAFTAEHTNRLIKIRLVADVGSDRAKPVDIEDSVTGRNTQIGYPESVCGVA